MESTEVWTLIGLLSAALFTLVGVIGVFLMGNTAELRDIRKDLTGLSASVASLDTRMASVEEKLVKHDRRFDSIDEKLVGYDRRFDSLEEQLRRQGETLGNAIYGLAEQFQEHLRRHAS